FDYELPPERIAQEPSAERDAARLLVVARGSDDPPHDAVVQELPRLLRAGDLLVVNRSRVIRARLHGRRLPGEGALEVLLIAPVDPSVGRAGDGEHWRALARPARRLHVGQRIAIDPRGHRDREAHASSPGPAVRSSPARPSVEAEIVAKGDGWI